MTTMCYIMGHRQRQWWGLEVKGRGLNNASRVSTYPRLAVAAAAAAAVIAATASNA